MLLYPILLEGGTNISPDWFPPIPIPSVSESLLSGVQAVRNKHIFFEFYKNKRSPPGYWALGIGY